jgi:hypothetical protein
MTQFRGDLSPTGDAMRSKDFSHEEQETAVEDASMILTASHTRPVAGLMDRLGHLSIQELIDEKRRLEKARRGPGIGPDEWYKLHAVKALITRHEVENLRHAGYTPEVSE